jgi:hypothetical protein
MALRTGATVVVVLALTATVLGATLPASGATPSEECRAIDDRQVCVQDLSTPETLIVGGERKNVSVSIENVGNTSTESAVLLGIVDPNNETALFQLGRPTLAPGEARTIDQPLNASTPGTHSLQFVLVDAVTQQRFDTSEVVTIEVRTEPPAGLGGPLDRAEFALAALVLALAGLGALAYRQVR